jgi:hypothetical protein
MTPFRTRLVAVSVLKFIDATTGDDVVLSLGSKGPANYNAELFAGSYDVFVATNGSGYQNVLPGDAYHKLVSGCP